MVFDSIVSCDYVFSPSLENGLTRRYFNFIRFSLGCKCRTSMSFVFIVRFLDFIVCVFSSSEMRND